MWCCYYYCFVIKTISVLFDFPALLYIKQLSTSSHHCEPAAWLKVPVSLPVYPLFTCLHKFTLCQYCKILVTAAEQVICAKEPPQNHCQGLLSAVGLLFPPGFIQTCHAVKVWINSPPPASVCVWRERDKGIIIKEYKPTFQSPMQVNRPYSALGA